MTNDSLQTLQNVLYVMPNLINLDIGIENKSEIKELQKELMIEINK